MRGGWVPFTGGFPTPTGDPYCVLPANPYVISTPLLNPPRGGGKTGGGKADKFYDLRTERGSSNLQLVIRYQ